MDHHRAAGWHLRRFGAIPDRAGCERVFAACVSEFGWMRGPQSLPPGWWREGTGLAIRVAEVREAGIVGFMMLNPQSGYVSYLLVERDWRLCGIGRGLLKAAGQVAGGPLSLDVDRENRFARAAYGALGFREVAAREQGGRHQIRVVATQAP